MLRLPTENTSDREEKIMAKLSDICELVNQKIKINVAINNNLCNKYISTENMLPNKQGISVASNIPSSGSVTLYRKDDTLVSNIRPYFKKIWLAEDDSCCSNDVLVFRAKNNYSSDYIYYTLANDTFFNYAMKTSKGTKMPRGDKKSIMNYDITLLDTNTQVKTTAILKRIDTKIDLNNKINNNLEQQSMALYKSWFVDFELNSGVMPSDWKVSQLGSIAKISTEVFSPAKNPNVEVEHYSIPAYDEKHYPIFETSNGIKSNKYRLTSNSVMISKLNPDTKRIWRPYCISDNPICSTEFIVYEPIKPLNRDFIYSIIDSIGFSAFLCSHTTGSTNSRQRATPGITLTYDIVVPDEKTIQAFCSIVSPMYDTIENNIKENQKLAETRDKLLPKLMSGELDVSDIEL